jgi:hypothetical protein
MLIEVNFYEPGDKKTFALYNHSSFAEALFPTYWDLDLLIACSWIITKVRPYLWLFFTLHSIIRKRTPQHDGIIISAMQIFSNFLKQKLILWIAWISAYYGLGNWPSFADVVQLLMALRTVILRLHVSQRQPNQTWKLHLLQMKNTIILILL